MTRMRAGPGRAALVGRRRLPELCSSAASPSSPPRCPPPPPGLRHRPGSLSPRSQGVSPPLGRPAPRPRHPGAGHWGARSRPGFPGAVERAERGERRAWLSAGQGRARGKVQPLDAAARPGPPQDFRTGLHPGLRRSDEVAWVPGTRMRDPRLTF